MNLQPYWEIRRAAMACITTRNSQSFWKAMATVLLRRLETLDLVRIEFYHYAIPRYNLCNGCQRP